MKGGGGPSSFDVAVRASMGEGGGKGFQGLFGISLEGSKLSANINGFEDQMLQISGAGNIAGFGEMIFAARGDGFFGKLLSEMFQQGADAFSLNGGDQLIKSHANSGEGGDGGGDGGGGGGDAGSNRPFGSLPSMEGFGPMQNVHGSMMGMLTPDSTPSMGGGISMDMGM